MGYIQDFEKEVRRLLKLGEQEELVRYVKDIVLESYYNGIMSGKKSEQGEKPGRKTKRLAKEK